MNEIVYTSWQSPLGELLLAAHRRAIVYLSFDGSLSKLRFAFPDVHCTALEHAADGEAAGLVRSAAAALEQYFAGDSGALDELPVDPPGTEFQKSVWRELRGIRSGSVRSYVELARTLGRPRAARAVGAACGRNPVVLAIPCHRVLASDMKLTGFSAGLERKIALLEHEGFREWR